jgi:hypothetical protein
MEFWQWDGALGGVFAGLDELYFVAASTLSSIHFHNELTRIHEHFFVCLIRLAIAYADIAWQHRTGKGRRSMQDLVN